MPDARPLKVLVVEDESLVALDIENMLEDMGYKVVASVPRLVRALEVASRLDFDLANPRYSAQFILREDFRPVPDFFELGAGSATLGAERLPVASTASIASV